MAVTAVDGTAGSATYIYNIFWDFGSLRPLKQDNRVKMTDDMPCVVRCVGKGCIVRSRIVAFRSEKVSGTRKSFHWMRVRFVTALAAVLALCRVARPTRSGSNSNSHVINISHIKRAAMFLYRGAENWFSLLLLSLFWRFSTIWKYIIFY